MVVNVYNYPQLNSVNVRRNVYSRNFSTTPANDSQASAVVMSKAPTVNYTIRTALTTREDIAKYTTILNVLEPKDKKVFERLLAKGVLLNSNSDDRSTVLDNLYKIATEPRAKGLNSENFAFLLVL